MDYLAKMATYCEGKEKASGTDENLNMFWRNAKIGFARKWADQQKRCGKTKKEGIYLKEELKHIFSGGCDLIRKDKQRQALKKLGFSIEERRKHFMLTYKGLKRDYHFTVSKTPSDFRTTMNVISVISRTLKEDEQ